MAIEQIKVGFDNFSYVIHCPVKHKAAIVDPSYDASKTLDFISSNNLELEYVIITHHHSDHSSDTQRIKNTISSAMIVASKTDGQELHVNVDKFVSDGDRLKLGEITLEFILTPGHTAGGVCIIVDNTALITGDTLFIGDCGRTDLPDGSLAQMFKTLNEKIKPLQDHLVVYPGHDYGDKPYDTLGDQKLTNKTLISKSLEDFSKIP